MGVIKDIVMIYCVNVWGEIFCFDDLCVVMVVVLVEWLGD